MPPRKSDSEKPRYAAPAVDQALDIIEYLSRNTRAYGSNELARALGISTNMAFRVLKRLTARGYAEAAPEGGYRLGTRFLCLGMRLHHRFDLRLRARPHLEWLCEKTHETCQVHVPDKDRVLVLDCLSPQADFFLQTTPGSRFYYHPNAFGKAILAFLPEAEVRAIVPEKLPALTSATLTTRKALLAQLEQVRRTGIAYDLEEYNAGFFCIGAPVFGATGKALAGIGITGVLTRSTPKRLKEYEPMVLACARRISHDIGYDGDAYLGFEKTAKAAACK
ncbi:MAG: IclR family transcriptional regulator [Kiritimatiellae bacterium]|nr:IclR family transcriptional regulator [Kiritimatiellia bacterium]